MWNTILSLSILAIGLIIVSGEMTGQTATYVQLGKAGIINCPNEKPGILKLCHWTRLDPTGKMSLNMSFIPIPNTTHDENYVHVLNAQDECGIVIKNVSQVDLTVWECLTALKDGNTVQRTSIQLLKAVRPTPPIIQHKRLLNNLVDDTVAKGKNSLDLKCCSDYGEPKPLLSFFMGDKRIANVKDDGYENGPNYCVEWDNATFTWEDDGKEVKCVQTHQTLSHEEVDSQIVNVFYAPELVDGHVFTLNMFFVSCNPKPDVSAVFKETNKTIDETLFFKIGVSTDHINAWNITSSINTTGLPIDTILVIRVTNPYGHLVIEIPSNLLNPEGTHTLGTTPPSTDTPKKSAGAPTIAIVITVGFTIGFFIFVGIVLFRWNGVECLRRNWTDMQVRLFAREQPATRF